MAAELQRLSAALAARMRELGCAPTDPRVAPLLAQVQALMRAHLASVQGANVAMLAPGAQSAAPAARPMGSESYDLPAALAALLKAYLATCPSNSFTQAPALSQSEEGRRILDLGPADRVKVAVQAYAALTSVPYGGPDGSGLRRVVSDLLRAKLALEEAQAIALVKAAIHPEYARAPRAGAGPEHGSARRDRGPARAHETRLRRGQCPGPQAAERRRGAAGAAIGRR